MSKKLGRLELVHWKDAATCHGWQHDAPASYEAANCMSVGWIVQDDKKVLVVAPNRHENIVGEPTVIPKGWITKRIVLRR
jgi:hypothetical protein